ncbi:hypothetical protein [Parasynechococcus sp.]|jgi:DnaJ-class molecular chaperone|uniref:hypothetical protein n=1 Tax=Parasynechococcus sp. TaxID=3101203 RepID=UPI0037046B6F
MSTCPTCGGSGMQRVSNQRFRTCFTCLGQGRITAAVQPASVHPLVTMTRGLAQPVCLAKPGL